MGFGGLPFAVPQTGEAGCSAELECSHFMAAANIDRAAVARRERAGFGDYSHGEFGPIRGVGVLAGREVNTIVVDGCEGPAVIGISRQTNEAPPGRTRAGLVDSGARAVRSCRG